MEILRNHHITSNKTAASGIGRANNARPFVWRYVYTIIFLIFSSILSFETLADSWLPMKPEYVERKHVFGETTIIRGIDGRENQKYPTHSIKVLSRGKLVALYPGLTFVDIAASKDNSLFVGVSNSGKPDTAIVVFDSEGRLGFWLRHNRGNLNYCRESVTLMKAWYDGENPDIQFSYSESGKVNDITLNSCKNERLSIDKFTKTPNKTRNEMDGSSEPPIR